MFENVGRVEKEKSTCVSATKRACFNDIKLFNKSTLFM